jgi:hypothetical protein
MPDIYHGDIVEDLDEMMCQSCDRYAECHVVGINIVQLMTCVGQAIDAWWL